MQVVDGRYRLVKRLGDGATGAVWVARDAHLGIDVALKLLKPRRGVTEEALARFKREAELAERMRSPHIVRVVASGVPKEGAPYIAYELLEGEDLDARLARDGRLGLRETRDVVVHTCRALARAHAIGVVHRDIKPGNLFCSLSDQTGTTRRMLVKVLDFGIADLVSAPGAELAGTLEYLAPEVVLGERAPGVASDLFALGVVAYECLTGTLPFPADNMAQLVLAHDTKTPEPARTRAPQLPDSVDAWLSRLLARDPDARFASASEAGAAFERTVDSAPEVRSPPARLAVSERRPPESTRYIVVGSRARGDEDD